MNDQNVIRDLALRATQGDLDAFQDLYCGTRQRAYFTALSITKNEADAQDILQESYLKAYQSLGQLAKPELFMAWLNQIVANKAKNYISRRRPDSFADYEGENAVDWQEETDPDFIPDERLDQKEAKALIAKMVKDLPEDQRLVVLMHYYNDMDVADMAKALEVPEGTVKSRLSRARQKLAGMLKEAQSKGIRFYSMAPIPFLAYFIKLLGFEDDSATRLPPLLIGTVAGGAGAAAAASSAGNQAAGTAARGVAKGVRAAANTARAATMPVKIAAFATAGIVAVGGITVAGVAVYRKKSPPAQEIVAAVTETIALSSKEATYVFEISASRPSQELSVSSKAIQPMLPVGAKPSKNSSTTAAKKTNAINTAPKTTTPAVTSTEQNVTTAAMTSKPASAATYPPYIYTTTSKANTESRAKVSWPAWPTLRATTAATTTTTTTATMPNSKTEEETTTTEPTTKTPVITFIFNPDSKMIMKYTGDATDVTIPDEIDGVRVQHLNNEAFLGSNVESVLIPQGVDCIQSRTFGDCSRLMEITIPSSVILIRDDAFTGCPNDMVIVCQKDSLADSWAKSKGIEIRYI